MTSPSDFHTRSVANEGIELPLVKPSGEATEHKFMIRGIDSDAYRRADADSRRRLLESIEKNKDDKEAQNQALSEERLRLLASLVASWTFPDPCTTENVVAFLKEAPQIADQIDRIGGRRALFFKSGSGTSTPSPEASAP